MKKTSLIKQIVIIYSILFTFMAGFGYFLFIPAIETPYVQETYTEINYQLDEYISFGTVSDRRYVYIEVPASGSTIVEGSNSMVLRSQTVMGFLQSASNSSATSGNGSLDISSQEKEILYGYDKSGGSLYFVGIIGEANPISGNSALMAQILGIVLFVFFLPIAVMLIWSLLVAQSIKSLNKRLKNNLDHHKTFILSEEIGQLDQAIGDYQKDIQGNEKEKQELFQNISHELKTPITTIQSYAEGLEDGMFVGEDLKKGTLVIQNETKKLLGSLNQIMELNRLSYQKQLGQTSTINVTNLSSVINKIIEGYLVKYPDVHFEVQLVSPTYKGEEKTWLTILTNIFENNIRHGAKTINIKDDKTSLLISNDGENIPPDLLPRLFTPFVKGEKGSYGLGLTIIKSALELNGYSIKIQNLDKGICYQIQALKK